MFLKPNLFTTSKMDHHLLRQKDHQIISVMKTNTLYVSRKLAFEFTFVLKTTKTPLLVFNFFFSLLRFFDEHFDVIIDDPFLTL